MDFYRESILFLPGVHLTDVLSMDDQFDKYMKDIVDDGFAGNIIDEIVIYDKIPHQYNKDTWPEKTNLKCWKCDCTFISRPLFIAVQSWNDEGGLQMIVDTTNGGNFCSPNCAYTCIMQDYPQTARQGKKSMLRQLLADLYPGQSFILSESLPKTKRIEYGGELTVGEYKKTNNFVEQLVDKN